MSINTCTFMGRLTTDVELKSTQSGVYVANFCIAVERKYQPQGEEKQTDFLDFVAWRNTAEFISKYFHKGSMIAVECEAQTRTFTDKNGNNRKAVEFIVNNASFCGAKQDNTSPDHNANAPHSANFATQADNTSFTVAEPDGDLPF